MICVADRKADIGRLVVINNMMKVFPTHEVVYLSQADLSRMSVPKEWLYILAHGSPDSVGKKPNANDGYSPSELARVLIKHGLQNRTKIEVRACSSGVPSSVTSVTYVTALVEQIRLQSNAKVIVYAQGYSGTGVIQQDGTYLAKDDILNNPAKQKQYRDIIDAGKSEIDAANLYIDHAMQQGTSLKDMAQVVAQMTKGTFAKLYEHNLTVTKNPEKSLDSSSLEAYINTFSPQWLNDNGGNNLAGLIEGVRWKSLYEWASTVPPNTNVYRVLSGQNLLH
jgi:hypothetical protein